MTVNTAVMFTSEALKGLPCGSPPVAPPPSMDDVRLIRSSTRPYLHR